MQVFNLGDNIIRLRHNKKLTQEDIASFVGVTKASVSKWENKQSMPDISLIPALATLFDVSIDELLGYEPQLSEAQIRSRYIEFSEIFVNETFEDAYKSVIREVKQYYNCYPFILQMCILMINHYNLCDLPKAEEVLLTVQKWCEHICENCKVSNVVEDAYAVHTTINFLLKKYERVVDALKETTNPLRISNNTDKILLQTYVMLEDRDNSEKYAQTIMYNSILNLVSVSALLLSVKMEDRDWCSDTIERIDAINASYHLDNVNMNMMVQYYYQAAVNKFFYGEKESGYNYLERFAKLAVELVHNPEKLYKYDSYFSRVEEWIAQSPLGNTLPRDTSFITSDLLTMMEHPVLMTLKGEQMYEHLKMIIKEEM